VPHQILKPGYSNGKCTKLHTVAVIIEMTLLLLVHVTYVCVLLFAHILFVVIRTFNATSTERLQQRPLLLAVNRTYCTFFL